MSTILVSNTFQLLPLSSSWRTNSILVVSCEFIVVVGLNFLITSFEIIFSYSPLFLICRRKNTVKIGATNEQKCMTLCVFSILICFCCHQLVFWSLPLFNVSASKKHESQVDPKLKWWDNETLLSSKQIQKLFPQQNNSRRPRRKRIFWSTQNERWKKILINEWRHFQFTTNRIFFGKR